MERTIDLVKIKDFVKKNLKLLLALPIAFLLISAIITFFLMTPKFEASTQVLVNQKDRGNKEQFMAQEVQSNIQLVNTYSEIVKSPRILDKTSKELKGAYSPGEISSMLNVSNQAETQLLNISVQSGNKKDSEKIANTIAKVFSDEVPDLMSVDNVSVLSKANGTAKQVSPNISINLLIGFVIGLFIAIVIAILREVFDKRIKSEEDVQNELDLPVLGSIQKFK